MKYIIELWSRFQRIYKVMHITKYSCLGCFFLVFVGVSPSLSSQPASAPVKVAPVIRSGIYSELQLVGTVTSPQVSLLSTEINGLVQELLVEDGSFVNQGELLLLLDSELAELQVQSATAVQEQASKGLADAQRRLHEAKSLVLNRSIAESTVLDLEAEVQLDEAALHQAEADAAYQKALLKRHALSAPFTGAISRKLVEEGEWVTNGTGIFELVAMQGLRLDFNVAEDFLSQIDLNGKLSVIFTAYPGRVFPSNIATLVPVTSPETRTFLLRTTIEPDHAEQVQIFPGMSVDATLLVDTGREGLVVPRDALLRNQDGRISIWTVTKENGGQIVTENIVQTGLVFSGQVEIRSGLTANARVVVAGNEALRSGQRVTVAND